jgi:hypothetical protein
MAIVLNLSNLNVICTVSRFLKIDEYFCMKKKEKENSAIKRRE